MLVVMDFHRFRVDVRLECVECVGKRRQDEAWFGCRSLTGCLAHFFLLRLQFRLILYSAPCRIARGLWKYPDGSLGGESMPTTSHTEKHFMTVAAVGGV